MGRCTSAPRSASVSRRLHITLSEDQYAFLNEEANRSSLSIAELVRRALDTTYVLAGPARVTVIEHTLGRRPGKSVDSDGTSEWHPRWRPGI
jgi:ribbon-helix-helix CopG family protein